MSEEQPRKTSSPWRWVLLVVAVVAAGYSVYYAGGVTTSLNDTPNRATALPRADGEAECPLAPELTLDGRVDVRFRLDTDGATIVAVQMDGSVEDGMLRVSGLTRNGVGTLRVGRDQYAEFMYRDGVCSQVSLLPPEPEPVAEDSL